MKLTHHLRFPHSGTLAALLLLCLTLLYPVRSQAATLLINLGYQTELTQPYYDPPSWWNKLPTWGTTSVISLYDQENQLSSVTWQTLTAFSGHSSATVPESAYGYPSNVTTSNFYLLSGSQAQVRIAGLNPATEYEFTFYGNVRNVAVTRGLQITATGAGTPQTTEIILQGTASHWDESQVRLHLLPSLTGEVILDLGVLAGYDRGIINAISINPIPEPGSGLLLLGLSTAWLLHRRCRSTR